MVLPVGQGPDEPDPGDEMRRTDDRGNDAGRFLGLIIFPGATIEVPDVRHYVRSLLTRHGDRDLAGDAELLASECVSNALRFTRSGAKDGRVAIKLLGLDDALRVEVLDQGHAATVPIPRGAPDSPEAENGRGLHLMQALSKDWGTTPYGPGTLTWFTLPRP